MKAKQWNKRGDVVGVSAHEDHGGYCMFCGTSFFWHHGMIRTPTGSLNVCLGDWVVTNESGEMRPIKPDLYNFLVTLKEKLT